MIHIVIILIVVGILLWIVNAYLPIDGKIKMIINVVVLICVVFWLLNCFGILNTARDIPVPQLH